MRKLTTISGIILFTLSLTSCGDGSPSACDCAEYQFESIQEAKVLDEAEGITNPTMSVDDYVEAISTPESIENTRQIMEKWEPKLKPCDEKAKADPSFKEEIDECFLQISVERIK